jgi:protein O-GlcNAc transferase
MASVDEAYRAAIRLHQQGRAADAGRLYDDILRQQPNHYGALHLKGVLALQQGDADTAIGLIRRSLEIEPKHGLALANLGVSYRAARRFDEGIAALRQAVELEPKNADAWNNLGQMLVRTGEVREAVAANSRALQLQPNRPGLRGRLLFARNYLGETDPVELKRDAAELGAQMEARAKPRTSHPNDPDPDRRIRVGLVSGDLRSHPVGRFVVAPLGQLDPAQIELVAYSTNRDADDITHRIRAATASWVDASELSDDALDAKIAADKIDILVDLSGWSGDVRLEVFAHKPAPVALTWLGYFATTGLTTIDYVLANKWVVPPGEEDQWTEKIWRMPDTYLCFTAPADPPPLTRLPSLSSGHITFGSFNNFNKLGDDTLAAWSALMAAVPDSRLILRSSGHYPPGIEAGLSRRIAAAGVDPARVRIDPKIIGYAAHLASYAEIDVALDPFPYNGGTTTVEALYMGVPVLVRAGDRYVAHMGESILNNIGLPGWIAPDAASYAALGARFATDRESLVTLRQTLRDRMLASPLFDAPRFARNLEAALRGMWQTWCAAQRRA